MGCRRKLDHYFLSFIEKPSFHGSLRNYFLSLVQIFIPCAQSGVASYGALRVSVE